MKFILFDTYISTILSSIDSKMFKNCWFDDEEKKDVSKDGDLSCALYISSVLKMFDLIKDRHVTVSGTVKDLEHNGWEKINELKKGSILVWEKKLQSNNEWHKHLGFYIGDNEAISNSWKYKVPKKHHYTYDNTRKIETIYWNSRLD
ncbi:MAG: hypothetical protein COV57_00175 [Candidatus Liptonbacteria bacterium CG11_big_fil_rev_8_21_14_0_20_35_14]|uniref:NlpC/P60 domain-containing protein n=1 Tax=Candidatus Liptonbacteria bacterium CG11_big_fil_rev_8_21_14_0_20_35_14 TaxID=1974634 RepID=A0A2H0NAY1_9BACT|nr:MAG: hypothetical protein COV57_00175 [Candidatus Liptonbacteria bacterium CG11_big_fil_rev_8_21_14_0_20_35_14]